MNSTLEHRLKRWSELQPSQVTRVEGVAPLYQIKIGGQLVIELLANFTKLPRINFSNRAHLTQAVLDAINAPETGLQLKLENDGNGIWYATLLDSACKTLSQGTNREIGLATLEAYLDWLEAGCEVEAAGGEA